LYDIQDPTFVSKNDIYEVFDAELQMNAMMLADPSKTCQQLSMPQRVAVCIFPGKNGWHLCRQCYMTYSGHFTFID